MIKVFPDFMQCFHRRQTETMHQTLEKDGSHRTRIVLIIEILVEDNLDILCGCAPLLGRKGAHCIATVGRGGNDRP
jgi:hypothetical protein